MSHRLFAMLLFFLCSASTAYSSGIAVHTWMAELAAEKAEDPALHTFLKIHEAAYKNGAIFPDSGYIIKHPYGEWAHWSPFLNDYFAEISDRCPSFEESQCQDLLAHFMGVLSHVIADINFDRHFVSEVGHQDCGGDVDKAQTFTDPGIDFIAILEADRGFKVASYYLPDEVLSKAFARSQTLTASTGDIQKGVAIVRTGLATEALGAPFAYAHFKSKMPWGSTHYREARGGVYDTADRIAYAWNLVWKAARSSERSLRFENQGSWPNSDFWINGEWLETFPSSVL